MYILVDVCVLKGESAESRVVAVSSIDLMQQAVLQRRHQGRY